MIARFLPSLLGAFAMLTLVSQAELSPEVVKNTARSIDQTIQEENTKKGIEANPIADDATFLRRAYLNIIGRIPTYQEAEQFLNDTAPDKRHKLIDKLVYSPGFESNMFNFYANMLRLKSSQDQFGLGWHVWLRDNVSKNTPYDKLVHDMLSATGHAAHNPAVGYYLRDRDMLLDNVSNTAQVFLGTQIGCAQCHDHPFEDWTQKQYYQFAAFGAEIDYKSETARNKIMEVIGYKSGQAKGKETDDKRKRRNNMKKQAQSYRYVFRDFRRNEISSLVTKTLKLPQDYQYNDGKPGDIVSPSVLFGSMPKLQGNHSGPQQMAAWVTSRDNPMFTKVIANRLWAHALGYGLAEPLDNWTERTNVSHPKVLEDLEKIMHLTNFDTRETLRVIYHTALFQREACDFEVEGGATHDFRGPLLRRMSAEEIHDSLLTMELGNIDDKTNKALSYRWESYKKGIDLLLDLPPEDLITLSKSTQEAERKTADLRAKISQLRTKELKLKQAGENEKAKQVRKEIGTIAREVREIRMSATDDKMISMSMTRNLRTKDRGRMRASENPSLYRSGSFLRDFGASDREITNSQHTFATIPQALTLLNGNETAMISDNKGSLADHMRKAKSAEARLEVLFVSIYAATPTEKEKAQLLPLLENARDTRVLAKAMLNSKRFIFVQ